MPRITIEIPAKDGKCNGCRFLDWWSTGLISNWCTEYYTSTSKDGGCCPACLAAQAERAEAEEKPIERNCDTCAHWGTPGDQEPCASCNPPNWEAEDEPVIPLEQRVEALENAVATLTGKSGR